MSKAQIIQGIMEKLSRTMRVAMPASIVTYDYVHQKASVKISLQEYYSEENIMEYPIISNVPVMFLSSGDASFTMPVKQGDKCLLLFMDRDISTWSLGSDNEAPKSKRSHHLNDAVAVIGLNNTVTKSKAENNQDVLITYSGSDIRLKPDGKIDIHSAAEVNVKTQEVIINCTNANLTGSDTVNVQCENAIIKANSKIDTETPVLTQKGNLKIEGNVDITGTTMIAQKLTTQNGIENSGSNLVSNGKTFETHTHQYQNVTTVIAPNGPCDVTKVPTNTGTP